MSVTKTRYRYRPVSNNWYLNYAHNERPGRGPAQVMQFGFD
jgi:hypothetical protein